MVRLQSPGPGYSGIWRVPANSPSLHIACLVRLFGGVVAVDRRRSAVRKPARHRGGLIVAEVAAFVGSALVLVRGFLLGQPEDRADRGPAVACHSRVLYDHPLPFLKDPDQKTIRGQGLRGNDIGRAGGRADLVEEPLLISLSRCLPVST